MKKIVLSPVFALNLIILLFGALLITQFYTLLFQHTLTTQGWIDFLDNLTPYLDKNSLRSYFVNFLKQTAPISTMIFAVGLFSSAVACMLLCVRSLTCFIVGIAFYIVWTMGWTDPAVWTFEYLFSAVFALLAALGTYSFSKAPQSVFSQYQCSTFFTLLCITFLSLVLYYVTSISFELIDFARKIALCSAITFFVFCLFAFYLTREDRENLSDEGKKTQRTYFCLDLMIVFIGAMLVMQVYANYFSDLFALNNFRASILYYAASSNASWIHPFLNWFASHTDVLLPLYMVFEIFLAVSLSLLFFRGPVLLMATALFIILAFSELGVSATWPPIAHILSWEWELLLVAGVSGIIGIQKTLLVLRESSLKDVLLGPAICNRPFIPLLWIVVISLLSGIILYFIGMLTHVFGINYQMTARYAGISFAVLIFILLSTNKYRRVEPLEGE